MFLLLKFIAGPKTAFFTILFLASELWCHLEEKRMGKAQQNYSLGGS
jgi:hypothetical protein